MTPPEEPQRWEPKLVNRFAARIVNGFVFTAWVWHSEKAA